MFLPNSHSFVLKRETIIKPDFPAFLPPHQNFWCGGLPNPHSFLLVRRPVVKSSFPPETEDAAATHPEPTDSEQTKVNDQGRRTFLKVASIAGAGVIASQLSPKKAQALIMGSSPTSNVVGVKDENNTRINPATEETLDEVLKTTDLSLDAGVLDVKVTSVFGEGSSSFSDSGGTPKSGRVDDDTRHVYVDVKDSVLPTSASTETTLQTISFGGFKFTLRLATDSGDSNIDYVGEANIGTATSTNAWRIKKVDSTTGTVIQYAGTGTFNQVWDNRESLTYS